MNWLVSPRRRTVLALIPLLVAAALTAIPWYFGAGEALLTAVATTFTAAVTASAAVYAAASLHVSVRRDRQGRAFALLAVLNLEEVCKAIAVCERLAASGLDSSTTTERLQTDPAELSAVRLVLFHFEDIAIAIEEDHAEEQILFRSLQRMVPTFWLAFEHYIKRERQKAHSDAFLIEFQTMAEAWSIAQSMRDQKRMPRRGRIQSIG